jgi:hypothetical protein
MSKLARAVALAMVALSLVAASGCGSDTKKSNDYVNAINKAQTDFVASVNKIQTGLTAQPGQAQKVFTSLKASVDKVVADLKAVTPPDKVKALHGQLVSQLDSFGKAIAEAGTALTSKDQAKIVAAQTKFANAASTTGAQITTTIGEINTKLQGG